MFTFSYCKVFAYILFVAIDRSTQIFKLAFELILAGRKSDYESNSFREQ